MVATPSSSRVSSTSVPGVKNSRHSAVDDPLGLGGILHLFADRNAVALFDQSPDVSLGGVIAARLPLGCHLDRSVSVSPSASCAQEGILVEHFVEVAHPEEQNAVRMCRCLKRAYCRIAGRIPGIPASEPERRVLVVLRGRWGRHRRECSRGGQSTLRVRQAQHPLDRAVWGLKVEQMGLEPTTSSMRPRRSPN